jgi:hypothetical protein
MKFQLAIICLNLTVALGASSQTTTISKDATLNSLQKCIRSNMGYSKYADARDTAYNKCSKELDAWFGSCSKGSIDAGPRLQCEQDLINVTGPIDKDWKLAHPDPPEQKDVKMESALQDLKDRHPLPGLPSLKKAVFLMKDSIVCSSPGAIVNPNRDLVLLMGACALAPRDIRVSVLPPADTDEYLSDHYHKIVAITWRSNEISNGTVHTGWTQMSRLRN